MPQTREQKYQPQQNNQTLGAPNMNPGSDLPNDF